MSDTTIEKFGKSLDGEGVNRIRNFRMDEVAVDPTVAETNQQKFNTVDGRISVFNSEQAAVDKVAYLRDLNALGRYRGTWDASTGIPTAAGSLVLPNDPIRQGDWWRIVVAGTITGVVNHDKLAPGDKLQAEVALGPTAADFVGLQGNIDDQGIVFQEELTVSLVADTMLTLAPAILANATVVKVLNGTADIASSIVITEVGGVPALQSSTAIAGLVVTLMGTTA